MGHHSVVVVSQLFRRVGHRLRQPTWWVPVVGAFVAYYRHRAKNRRATEQRPDDVTTIAATIAKKMDAGLLPREPPRSLQAGRGDGSPCSACDRPIRPEEHEWSFWSGGVLTHRFHITCHRLWEAECRKRGWHDRRGRKNSRD
jgi:hypothetical protein